MHFEQTNHLRDNNIVREDVGKLTLDEEMYYKSMVDLGYENIVEMLKRKEAVFEVVYDNKGKKKAFQVKNKKGDIILFRNLDEIL